MDIGEGQVVAQRFVGGGAWRPTLKMRPEGLGAGALHAQICGSPVLSSVRRYK